MLLQTLFLTCYLTNLGLSAPPVNDKALFPDGPEERRKNRRPCRGRSPEGRTFLDWSFQFVDIDYNTNYNTICAPNRPNNQQNGGLLSNHFQNQQGGGHLQNLLGNRPQNTNQNNNQHGGLLGGNRPLVGNGQVTNFLQMQTQSLVTNLGNIWPQDGLGSLLPQNGLGSLLPQNGLGSLLPQNGLFNGEGIGSLFQNGLLSGIFNNRPGGGAPAASPAQASPPINNPVAPTDPDDVIYNDDKPVHEENDPIVPDTYNFNLNRPAPYRRPNYYQGSNYNQGYNYNQGGNYNQGSNYNQGYRSNNNNRRIRFE